MTSRNRRLGMAIVAVLVAAGGAGAATLLGVAPWQAGGSGVTIPHFVDETVSGGLDFAYDGPFAYAVGGGVAVFDCDGDGREDIYLAGGAGPAALFRNDSQVAGPLRFSRLAASGAELDEVNGAYPIDVDGDGKVDLMTLRYGENVALRGLGDCRFERANEAWALDGGDDLTEAFSATWEAGSDWPTMAFGNYATPGGLDPHTWCETNQLVRPAPGGVAFGTPTPLEPSFCPLSMLFSDWDGSGRMDLRISNDRQYYDPDLGEEQLWRIAPREAPRLYTADEGWTRFQIQGMGIASQDLTGDGLPEVYLTSQSASRLQKLVGGASEPEYENVGLEYGVNVAQPFTGGDHLPSTAWHPEFDDVNNDGRLDLLVTKGNVTEQPDYAKKDPTNLLLGQPDGTFKEAADVAGILTFDRARGAALADFNLDGRPDLVLVNYGAPVRLWRNDGSGSHASGWLSLRISQRGANADAIGAVVEVKAGDRATRREVTIGGGHAGGQLGWLHFGLGSAPSAEIRVTWPGGEQTAWQPVETNRFYELERGEAPLPWVPPGGAE
jgi:enediyne biosynthesis protein E4